jgi:hypothetical protein
MAALGITTSSVGALSSAGSLIGALSGLIAASPTATKGYLPQNATGPTGLLSLLTGPPSLLFHYEGEQTITLQSDVTDHFIEDNTTVQDQVALKPVLITTHGFIGELNNVAPATLALLQQAANTLTSITAYNPALTLTALNAYNSAFSSYQLGANAVNSAVGAISSLGGNTGESVIGSIGTSIVTAVNQNKQQTMFQQLFGYWQTRTLFTVQTPWAIFQNCIIQLVHPVQDDTTLTVTDFQVTFKQLNFAQTTTTNVTQGQLSSQSAAVQNNGNVALNPAGSATAGIATQTGSP